jgi:hypothetical protein
MKKRMASLCLLLICAAGGVYAQSAGPDVCSVGVMDYSAKKPEEQEFVLSRWLGKFEPVVGEEERTTHAYRIPGTRLFAVASVFYTDESMQVAEMHDSISLQVSVSRKAKHDPINSLNTAEAEVMYGAPYVARVYTPLRVRGRPKLIVMECRREAKD